MKKGILQKLYIYKFSPVQYNFVRFNIHKLYQAVSLPNSQEIYFPLHFEKVNAISHSQSLLRAKVCTHQVLYTVCSINIFVELFSHETVV